MDLNLGPWRQSTGPAESLCLLPVIFSQIVSRLFLAQGWVAVLGFPWSRRPARPRRPSKPAGTFALRVFVGGRVPPEVVRAPRSAPWGVRCRPFVETALSAKIHTEVRPSLGRPETCAVTATMMNRKSRAFPSFQPPFLKAFILQTFLPASVFAPVDFSQGFQLRINRA